MPPSPSTISPAQQTELLAAAQRAAHHAYAPYSGFRVGAALLLESGDIVTATNVESTSFGLTLCAERAAVARAIAEHGAGIRVVAAAVANLNSASSSPCGACRQVLAEFMPPTGQIFFPAEGVSQTRTLAELLPFGFYLAYAE